MVRSGFTRIEAVVVFSMIGVVILVSLVNLKSAEIRSRDAQRVADVRRLYAAVWAYYDAFEEFPAESKGRVVGCTPPKFTDACEWGGGNFSDTYGAEYMKLMPTDPGVKIGRQYVYRANAKKTKFQLFAALENGKSEYVVPDIVQMQCGNARCNFGMAGGIPLNENIE